MAEVVPVFRLHFVFSVCGISSGSSGIFAYFLVSGPQSTSKYQKQYIVKFRRHWRTPNPSHGPVSTPTASIYTDGFTLYESVGQGHTAQEQLLLEHMDNTSR